ncbi:MAG: phospholipid transport system substrate-binding protein [Candidatus Midichloriaceae bacterium]|jgi:phospholipid transport system substrate-binding protein
MYTFMFRKFYLVFLLLFLFISPVLSNEKEVLVVDFVKNTAHEISSVMRSTDIDNDQKLNQLNRIFCKVVDINWMGKFAIGKYYKQLNKSEILEYKELYKNFLIQMYAPKFTDYNGESLKINSVKSIGNSQYIISTTIVSGDHSGKNIMISYRIKEKDGVFKILDIIPEGISLVFGQRSDFTSVISQHGVDGLLDKIREKIKF